MSSKKENTQSGAEAETFVIITSLNISEPGFLLTTNYE